MSTKQEFLSYVQRGDVNEVYNFLRTNPECEPYEVVNEKGYTGLHLASLNNHPFLIQVLIRHVKDTYPAEKDSIIKQWIEQKTLDEEFTCLHFAVFRGNIKIAKMLIEIGADLQSVNKQGLSVMHLAAQGDQALLLAHFKELHGLSVEETDSKGGTPLHWAAYLGSEAATSILLSWKPPINYKDSDGQTPLHLATISYNARIVRLLLLKGAERGIRDNKGKSASDIAHD